MVPDRFLIHDVVRVRPVASTDPAYGTTWDYGTAAARATVSGWLEQTGTSEAFTDARDVIDQRWTLITNYLDVDANDRIEWGGHPAGTKVFQVDGPPEPAYTPRGADHLEARLRIVEG